VSLQSPHPFFQSIKLFVPPLQGLFDVSQRGPSIANELPDVFWLAVAVQSEIPPICSASLPGWKVESSSSASATNSAARADRVGLTVCAALYAQITSYFQFTTLMRINPGQQEN
jgi:hypothetical protein